MAEIQTTRLCLRQWRSPDLLPFAAMNADPQVMEFFPACLTLSESDALAHRCQALIADRGWGFWAVEILGVAEFIGFVGLHTPTAALPFQPCVEVGWRLARPYWGQGYATEAAHAALAFGFRVLQLAEIVSFTSVLNMRSQAVMERLGMVRSPETFLHPNVPDRHPLQEHCWYRLSQNHWRSIERSTKDLLK